MPSNYYKYNFVSPDRLYARVQEEMRPYFATGAVDSLMFPIWTEDCIRKFRSTYLPIKETVVTVCNGAGSLPEDCKKIREAWMCNVTYSQPFSLGAAYYYPETCVRTVTNQTLGTDWSHTHEFVHKVTSESIYQFHISTTLTEGIVRDCGNTSAVYEVEEGKLRTSVDEGAVYITYYSDGKDDYGYQMIPDEKSMERYIREYIKTELFLQLVNQCTDEGFNRIYKLYKDTEQRRDEALIIAQTESKKESLEKKKRRMIQNRHRNDGYKLK